MKPTNARVALTATLAASLLVGVTAYSAIPARESVSVPAAKLRFVPTGIQNPGGEVLVAPAFGNLATGRHASFIRIPGRFNSGVHTHTGDYYATVIAGAIVNGPPGSRDIRLTPGSYWFQKGGERHVTKCVSRRPCVFFVNQDTKFDFLADNG